MDLVLNHSSNEHRWFKEAKKSKDNPYHDYYIWRDGEEGMPPSDMKAVFGGSAWEYVPEIGQYYFHQFLPEQPDLNWENPKVIGFPNVGKSTLLSVVSKAQPKIANYHFTTLYPNLGVVWVDEGVSFVMADIPGIIEGASEGAGLGHDFLRHIDRCRLLVHVVDVSGSEGRDPVADFDAINAELEQYSPDLAKRPQIVAANKVDIMTDPENLERLRAHVEAKGFTLMEISAAAHQGTRELVGKVAEALASLPPVTVYEPEYVPKPPVVDTSEPLDIQRLDDGHTWLIQGLWLQRLMANVNFDDYESRMWFDKALRESGLYQQLEERGIEAVSVSGNSS